MRTKTKADLVNFVLAKTTEFLQLVRLVRLGVNVEVLVCNNDLLVPLVNFSLLDRQLLCDHIVTAHKDSIEEFSVRERLHTLNLRDPVRFRNIVVVLLTLTQSADFGFPLLDVMGHLEFINLRLWGPLGMLIVIFFLVEDVKSCFSLPALFIFFLRILSNLILINFRESQ